MPTWITGSGKPTNNLGVNGDYYIDTDSKKVYERLDGVFTPSGFLTEYGGMPEKVYKIRKEHTSLQNHLNNLLAAIEQGVLDKEEYADRLAELRAGVKEKIIALQKTDYNMI